jgi:hypothetical protein
VIERYKNSDSSNGRDNDEYFNIPSHDGLVASLDEYKQIVRKKRPKIKILNMITNLFLQNMYVAGKTSDELSDKKQNFSIHP